MRHDGARHEQSPRMSTPADTVLRPLPACVLPAPPGATLEEAATMLQPEADPHACLHLTARKALLPRLDGLPAPFAARSISHIMHGLLETTTIEEFLATAGPGRHSALGHSTSQNSVAPEPRPPSEPRTGWQPAPPSKPSPRRGMPLPQFSPRVVV